MEVETDFLLKRSWLWILWAGLPQEGLKNWSSWIVKSLKSCGWWLCKRSESFWIYEACLTCWQWRKMISMKSIMPDCLWKGHTDWRLKTERRRRLSVLKRYLDNMEEAIAFNEFASIRNTTGSFMIWFQRLRTGFSSLYPRCSMILLRDTRTAWTEIRRYPGPWWTTVSYSVQWKTAMGILPVILCRSIWNVPEEPC